MELYLRIVFFVLSKLAIIFNIISNWILPRRKPTYPPIRNPLLTKSLGELVLELRQRKLTAVALVEAYIARIQEVNPSLNAVIEERFDEAIKEAQHADQLIAKSTTSTQLANLFARYPLLGIPFTVKEACGVKGLSHVVGSIHRKRIKCSQNGDVVELFRAAGCIPLLVSATPEFCLNLETKNHINGRCLNPYDLRRTSGGSSGGESALNGSGASLFGIGSDIVGSIRLPCLFCGIFGHKATGGLISNQGHFPYSTDPNYQECLQIGPMTRFARDLPVLLEIMAGENAKKLKFEVVVPLKDIKIYHTKVFTGLQQLYHVPVDFDIKLAITRAVRYFENGGLSTEEVKIQKLSCAAEIFLTRIGNLQGVPSIMTQSSKNKPERGVLIGEFLRSIIGHSLYTYEAIFCELLLNTKAFIKEENMEKWRQALQDLKTELLQLLGKNSVLFIPTLHTTAYCFNMSLFNSVGFELMAIFNVLGFPATHVPMGLNERGMPIGFQVVAAPYQDKLCLQIATELESAFGGWVPPLPNEF